MQLVSLKVLQMQVKLCVFFKTLEHQFLVDVLWAEGRELGAKHSLQHLKKGG